LSREREREREQKLKKVCSKVIFLKNKKKIKNPARYKREG
jgi:hypothetical protein